MALLRKDGAAIPDTDKGLFLEAHVAAIVEGFSDAIISKDLDGNILSWNSAAEKLFGWTAQDIVGKPMRTLIPESRFHEEDTIIASVCAGESVENFQTERRHKDGHLIPLAITVSPIRSSEGTIIAASHIAHDLREQVAMRKRLDESENKLQLLADNISQLAWIADETGSIFWYNQRWYDYTGSNLEEMRGWGWQKVHHPEYVEAVTEKFARAIQASEEWEDTFPLRRKDGEYRWFLSRAKPIFDEQGVVKNWFGTNTDITQQRNSEEHVRLLLREVNHRAKNMLAVIQSVISLTASGEDQPFVERIRQRISALSANQDLLINSGWTGAPVVDIINSQLGFVAQQQDPRVCVSGTFNPLLDPRAAEVIGLAIHELAVNSAKYGALSNGVGQIHVSTQNVGSEENPRLKISWREVGGPKVVPPTRTGFGTTLMTRNPKIALRADVTLDYAPEGVIWELSMPAPTAKVAELSPQSLEAATSSARKAF